MAAPSVFISYAHADEAHKNEVVKHLRALNHTLDIEPWSDDRIEVGSSYRAEIDAALGAAAVAILLISVDSLASDFIRVVELPRLLERRRAEGMLLIPVLVRECGWQQVPWLEALQVANPVALTRMNEPDREGALARVAERVRHHVAVRGPEHPAPAAPPPARPVRARPVLDPRNVDREAELQTFLGLFDPRSTDRVLVVEGTASMGKTWFLQKCLVHQPADSTVAWIDFKELGVSVPEIILHTAESWEHGGARFPATFQTLQDQLRSPAPQTAMAERMLTKSLLDEARRSRLPGSIDLVIIDHLEFASAHARDWVVKVLVHAVVRDAGLALVVAGQRTADVAATSPFGVAYRELTPLSPDDTAALAVAYGLDLPPDELALYYRFTSGNPLALALGFDRLRRTGTAAGTATP